MRAPTAHCGQGSVSCCCRTILSWVVYPLVPSADSVMHAGRTFWRPCAIIQAGHAVVFAEPEDLRANMGQACDCDVSKAFHRGPVSQLAEEIKCANIIFSVTLQRIQVSVASWKQKLTVCNCQISLIPVFTPKLTLYPSANL